jgi:hypothetical protein
MRNIKLPILEVAKIEKVLMRIKTFSLLNQMLFTHYNDPES